MSAIKALLFDCDGVLLDSEPMGCGALALAMTEAGYPMTQSEARAVFSGNSAQDSQAWMKAQGFDADHVFRRSDEILFEMFAKNIPLIEGIEEILFGFDLQMAVCSNASIERLGLSLKKTALAKRFGPHIYSGEHVPRPKPAPDLALHACAALGIAPHEAVFIDDNIHGIHCAKAAGCLAIGFIAPSDDRKDHVERLFDAGADHVLHSMSELRSLLHKLTISQLEEA